MRNLFSKPYLRAICLFSEDTEFIVFSDDIDWCERYFVGSRFLFAYGGDELEDFRLMSQCQYHIISNSTFSWWASWINGEIVIAPKTWFGSRFTRIDTRDIYREEMIKL
jgi:Glycosyl transferase family 11